MSDSTPSRSGSRLVSVIVSTGLALVALLVWSFSASTTDPATRVSLFLAAVAALFGALRRHAWPALVLVGVMALGMNDPRLRALDVWDLIFLVCTSLGTAMWLQKWSGVRWILASLPFWAQSDAADWPIFVALGLSIGGLAIAAVGPTLPGRRLRSDGTPMPQLASGPIASVVPRFYTAGQRSRAISVATLVFTILAVAMTILSALRPDPGPVALAISSVIIATTFAFSNWFAGRVLLRIDEQGLHSRTLFREHTVPWSEIVALSLRYVVLGMGLRLVYYCVRSTTREFAFSSRMVGAKELQVAIEQATGVAWPEPEIEANF